MSDHDRVQWDGRWAARPGAGQRSPAWLDELTGELPGPGPALDLAAGAGRVALWLARRGFAVTALDISPVGLALARDAAAHEGLRLRTTVADLEREPLPAGPFAVIALFHYRQPDLWPAIRARLAPGGVVLAELATVRNLERHQHPSRRWLAAPNEVLHAAQGLEVVSFREGWLDGQHLARLIARKA